ncbi:TPA: hypothetical protein MD163_002443 [Klebsiella aerogenes]|nr:hypothetical protein [Klebsiella aerogenes]
MRQIRRRFAPKPKKWKPGEMKAYLAEQRAIAQGKENDRVAGEMYRAHLEWVKRVQADWRRTCTRHVRQHTEHYKQWDERYPMKQQYEDECLRNGVPLVLEGMDK